MTFAESKILVNNDSNIRTNVEATARIILSEIEYILSTLPDVMDTRHKVFLIESAITKTASAFQLAMKACDYLERSDYKMSIIAKTKKGNGTNIGIIGSLRDEIFHNGNEAMASERFYSFAHIKGRGYVGIYIHTGASLKITGQHTFQSNLHEFAITSDGIYQVENVGTCEESWILMPTLFNITTFDAEGVLQAISGAVNDLKVIWKELRDIRLAGDGTHEYSYLNEGGSLELLEKGKEGLTSYKMVHALKVQGDLTITPPDGVKVNQGSLAYYIQNDSAQQNAQPDALGAG